MSIQSGEFDDCVQASGATALAGVEAGGIAAQFGETDLQLASQYEKWIAMAAPEKRDAMRQELRQANLGREPVLRRKKSDAPGQKSEVENNPFFGLRRMALDATPELPNFDPARSGGQVYGAMMDWGLGTGVATLFALDDGTASLYLSTGGGIIGGGFHEAVKTAARLFVSSL